MSFSKALDFFIAEYPELSSDYIIITDSGIAGFSRISGITICSDEFRPFTEGGLKDVHILAEQNRQFETLVLEKGVGRTDILDALGPLKTFIIVTLSKRRMPKRAYAVLGAVLQKISLSDLNAGDSSVLISSATVAYRKINAISLMGLTDELMPAAAQVAGTLASEGVSAAVSEVKGKAAQSVENGAIAAFKSVNSLADESQAKKFMEKTEEKLEELAFWE